MPVELITELPRVISGAKHYGGSQLKAKRSELLRQRLRYTDSMRKWTAASYALSLRSSKPVDKADFFFDQVCELGDIQYRLLKYKYLARWTYRAQIRIPYTKSYDQN